MSILLLLQISGLIAIMISSWLIVSLLSMLVPVWLGRQVFALFLSSSPRIYELYTSATGVYLCLLLIKLTTVTTRWNSQGWAHISQRIREWGYIVSWSLSVAS